MLSRPFLNNRYMIHVYHTSSHHNNIKTKNNKQKTNNNKTISELCKFCNLLRALLIYNNSNTSLKIQK